MSSTIFPHGLHRSRVIEGAVSYSNPCTHAGGGVKYKKGPLTPMPSTQDHAVATAACVAEIARSLSILTIGSTTARPSRRHLLHVLCVAVTPRRPYRCRASAVAWPTYLNASASVQEQQKAKKEEERQRAAAKEAAEKERESDPKTPPKKVMQALGTWAAEFASPLLAGPRPICKGQPS